MRPETTPTNPPPPSETDRDADGLDRIDRWIREYLAMDQKLNAVLAEARHQRDQSGRSEKGRLLAILATKLEEALAWWEYLERQEPTNPVPGDEVSA